MQIDNTLEANNKNATYDNGIFGIVSLFLILISAFGIHGFLLSLVQDNNRIEKLWEPNEETLYFVVPVFVIVSLLVIWIISSKSTPMKKIFKIATIIGFILFVVYSLCIGYLFALGSAMGNH